MSAPLPHRPSGRAAARPRRARTAVAAAALLLGTTVVAQAQSASAAVAARVKPPFPAMRLAQPTSQGARAIELLGDRLPEVAAWYGKSPDEFRALLLNDRRLRIDDRGRLFVEETLDRPLPADTPSATASSTLTGALAPLDQTYLLHSRPGAKRTIYLNFRGAVLSNTAWNGTGGTITAPPFDLDGVPYSNSTLELERVQYIWQRVSEDYAPFDVDVTTEPPPADALTRSGSSDTVFGTTVLITTRSGVYSCSCGGVAYIGVFDSTGDYYKPALVFYDALGSGNEKYVAEAISHEAGHNMGLQHDGYSGGGYYSGQGSGATGWAPIMGVGYYQALVQWSKGEYATANNSEDDYVVMQSNGLPLRADDHGGTAGSATPLTATVSGASVTLAGDGVIERPGDVDMFSFSAAAGAASFSIVPAARSGNVDLRLELRNAAGTLLASANPADALGASIAATLPATGTYTLAVTGVGKGDPLTTGYTAYGSVGQYGVSGTVVASTAGQPPTAVLSATPTGGTAPLTVAFSAAGSSDPDGSITGYAWTFGDGGGASGPTASHTYQSAGTFTAELRVTDDTGLSATRSTTITVAPAVAVVKIGVTDIALSLSSAKGGKARAVASVAVRDTHGQPVAGATVSAKWSGVVSGNVTGVTGSDGVVRLNSPLTRSSGTFTLSVTGVAADGFLYDVSSNVETSDSITR
jgi:PKD repeat protein